MTAYDRIKHTNVIPITQGSDYYDTITVKKPDPLYPNDRTKDTLLNLTGYDIESQLRDLSGAIKGTFVCTAPFPATGVISRHLPKEVTALLTPAIDIQHVWGVQLSSVLTGVLPEIQGGAVVDAGVVHA